MTKMQDSFEQGYETGWKRALQEVKTQLEKERHGLAKWEDSEEKRVCLNQIYYLEKFIESLHKHEKYPKYEIVAVVGEHIKHGYQAKIWVNAHDTITSCIFPSHKQARTYVTETFNNIQREI